LQKGKTNHTMKSLEFKMKSAKADFIQIYWS
jgi:hypothetical protein